MLVDSKTPEIAGGFRFNHVIKGVTLFNRFIHWRTNDVYHEMKITFEGSPILAFECYKTPNHPLLMIFVTTTSVHRMSFEMPDIMDRQLHIEQESILFQLNENIIMDPFHCYNFTNDVGQAVPVAAAVTNSRDNLECKIAIACTNSLHLLTLRVEGEKIEVKCSDLDHNPLKISKIIHSIADSLRRKSDSSQVVTMSYNQRVLIHNQSFLYTLHRNGLLRVWLPCGRCLVSEHLSKYTQSSETECEYMIISL
uniref:Nucleoporin Nup120/160 beta-propeller domain-containing protein n=1 Tax=Anopheles epiroticus TaxID=199890 RepID=A0A182PVN4_9DIPT